MGGVLIVGATLAACSSGTSTSGPTTSPTFSPATTVATAGSGQPTNGITLSTSVPPWPLPTDAGPDLAAAGLQVQSGETLQVHYHVHVDIINVTQGVVVPAGIGFLIQKGQAIGLTSLHTHDTTGIVHIESTTNVPFTLGQVFTEWDVRLTANQVGGLVIGNGNTMHIEVNGTVFTGDPATIVLRPHQEIGIWYGPASTTPQIPSRYSFPPGD